MPKNWFSPWRWFDFTGRASRREYFLYLLIGFAIYFAPLMLMMMFAPETTRAPGAPLEAWEIPLILLGILWSILSLLVLVMWIAVAVRRVHDSDKSAWFLLLGAIPLIGWIFGLIWVFSPGDEGKNNYGPDPREPVAESFAGVFD